MKFKSLSIVYPNGTKIALGEKTIEVRSWQPQIDSETDLLIIENKKFLHTEGEFDPEGVPVAIVKIKKVRDYLESDIQAACASRWEAGYYSWELTDVRPLSHQAAAIAARGIYELDLELIINQTVR